MQNGSKFFAFLFLSFLISESYAIQVNLQSTSNNIEGLGFTVNGEQHGGIGAKYHASDAPKGSYTFGLRVEGNDVGCVDKAGKKIFKLSSNATAILDLRGTRCILKIYSK